MFIWFATLVWGALVVLFEYEQSMYTPPYQHQWPCLVSHIVGCLEYFLPELIWVAFWIWYGPWCLVFASSSVVSITHQVLFQRLSLIKVLKQIDKLCFNIFHNSEHWTNLWYFLYTAHYYINLLYNNNPLHM